MAVDVIDGPKDGIALQRLAMIIHLKIVVQDTLYSADYAFLV